MQLDRLIEVYFNPEIFANYLPDILKGAWVTLQISVAVIVVGVALGLGLALLRLAQWRPLVLAIVAFVDIFRAIPPLAIILLLYFGLPNFEIYLSAFWVVWLTLTLVLAAFAEEIFWAGLTAIGRGQWEAARSTGMTYRQTLGAVILPQAVRICVPPLTNRAIATTKNSALGTVIGVPELLNEAMTAQSFSGNATPLMMAAAGYLIIFVPLVVASHHIERRLTWGART